VQIKYVRGKQTVLRVFADGVETAVVTLSNVRTKERMHKIMQEQGFELKSEEERSLDADIAKRVRQQRNLSMFFRKEYLRKQHLHTHLFREEVMLDTEYNNHSWVYQDKDLLRENYDKIFRSEAVYKYQLLEYAKRYLVQVGRL
jgi:hypothetical protein